MKTCIILLLIIVSSSVYSQTMMEMSNPNDANIVLLEVQDTTNADIVVYLSDIKEEYQSWDCIWKIKEWGFSNFTYYLAQSESDTLLFTDDDKFPIPINGKVYFTDNKSIRGYRNNKVHIDGMMRKVK